MLQVPQEIASLIVHQLDSKHGLYNCTLINKTFHQVANPLLWRTLEINNDAATRIITCLQSVPNSSLGGGRFVRHLVLCMTLWTDDEFLLVMQHTTHLERLSMNTPINITDRSLKHLPRHCPRLNDLELTIVPIAQPTMDALGQHCHQLTRLTLHDCNDLGPDTFSSLMPCPLTCLNIEGPPAGLTTTTKVIKDLVSHGFDQLTHLTLGNSKFDDINNEFISNLLSLAATPDTWPRLTHLWISCYIPRDRDTIYGHGAFASGLVRFLQSHGGGLEHLGLVSGQYNDSVLDAIGAIRPPPPRLTSLSLVASKKITARGVRRLVQQWPMLSSVSLGSCLKMTLDKFPEVTNNNDIIHFPIGSSSTRSQVQRLDEEATRMIRQGSNHGVSQLNN
ncbi:unnamed protein product [Absidia cylindrospora]